MCVSSVSAELPQPREKCVAVERPKLELVSLHSDLIPDELLTTLVSTVCPLERPLQGQKITKTPKDFKVHGMRSTDAVWHHPVGRKKYKHLLDQPTSLTGAGRDISFLCDAMVSQRARTPLPPVTDRGSTHSQDTHKDVSLKESLIPEEFHIVKNRGVVGLNCYEDKYTVLLEDEEQRLRVFPSMMPSSRLEAVQLMKVMDEMLDKAGVNQEFTELKELSQMEGLLELVRVEQNIYNAIFHELIRQVSVQCAERGQLLAKLRRRYAALLERIPQQLKGLHTETLAQRALDRRLTEEIVCLKGTITQLNTELGQMKDLNDRVSRQAEKAQEELAKALEQSRRNSDLVGEYRELYEMQRQRLEGQVARLTDERDRWSKVTYSLALKVIKANSLQLAGRLHVSEQAWTKTAKRFTALLTSKDTEDLSRIVKLTDQWKEVVAGFVQRLNKHERSQCEEIKGVQAGIAQWQELCGTSINSPDGKFEKESEDKLFVDLKHWAAMLTVQCERYGGEDLLSCQETLNLLSQLQEDWVDTALGLFRRHPRADGEPPKGQESMRELSGAVSELHRQLGTRVTGESGVHKLLISLVGAMELWATRLKAVSGQPGGLPRYDWLKLERDLGSWTKLAEESLHQVSSTQTDSERVKQIPHVRIEIHDVFTMMREFLSTQDTFFDCENQRLCEEVSCIHSALTRWMVDLLLLMVPDCSDDEGPPLPPGLDNKAPHTISPQKLVEDANHLTQKLDHFSKYLISSCLPIIEGNIHKHQAQDESENELYELNKLQRESGEWREACRILLLDVTGFEVSEQASVTLAPDVVPSEEASEESLIDEDTAPPSDIEEEEEEEAAAAVREGEEGESPEPVGKDTEEYSTLTVEGHGDGNTEKTAAEETVPASVSGSPKAVVRSQTPDTQRAWATVETLQLQLLDAESRAQSAEEHALLTEEALQAALEKIRDLELQLKARASLEQKENKKSAATPPRKGVPVEHKTVVEKPEPSPKQRQPTKKRGIQQGTPQNSQRSTM
ncbi:axonemal dynein light chain domain-containing protein 1 [Megalops cyprinoides]|uniref:axonemal dynein light chain domain-containing protein 1 n=1 Tax=Megalops cyprinoides TaxID=118141 RepID=UPI001864C8FC|nr:axonemal dynein light chain domain-containing protein 1 [Megalops cyprinoides]